MRDRATGGGIVGESREEGLSPIHGAITSTHTHTASSFGTIHAPAIQRLRARERQRFQGS